MESCDNKKCDRNSNNFIKFQTDSSQLRTYCTDCVNDTLKKVAPNIFATEGLQYDGQSLSHILTIDKSTAKRCLEVLAKNTKKIKRRAKPENKPNVYKMEPITAKTVKEHLDRFVISQDSAKIGIAKAYSRMSLSVNNDKIKKINTLLVGPTASGKTEIVRTLSKLNNVEVLKVDCSHLVPSGYKGSYVTDILPRLLRQCAGDLEKAQNSIILLDEIDKLANTKDNFYKRVQQELLKLIEGGTFEIEYEKGEFVRFDTKNVLFIGAGAFVGIERQKIVKKSLGLVSNGKTQADLRELKVDDVVNFGIIPELAGRFSQVCELKKLGKEELKLILKREEDGLSEEYKEIFKASGFKIDFTEAFYEEVAKRAYELPTGARALKSIIEDLLEDELFNMEVENSEYIEVLNSSDNVLKFEAA